MAATRNCNNSGSCLPKVQGKGHFPKGLVPIFSLCVDMALAHEQGMLSLNRNHIFVITYCCCITKPLGLLGRGTEDKLHKQHCLEASAKFQLILTFSESENRLDTRIFFRGFISHSLGKKKTSLFMMNNTPGPATICRYLVTVLLILNIACILCGFSQKSCSVETIFCESEIYKNFCVIFQ